MPLFLLLLRPCLGLEPDELVIAINRNAPHSEEIARSYAALRGIPEQHLIHLDAPALHRLPLGSITRKSFVETIWEPLGKAVEARGLNKKIVAVIYSSGFPISIQTAPAMSLTGITYSTGINPGAEVLKKGNFYSPFFAGPGKPGGAMRAGETLRAVHDRNTGPLPPASMLLGNTGPRGMTRDEIIYALHRSRNADFTRPKAPVYIIDIPDVRSKCRRWQIDGVRRELAGLGRNLSTQDQWPPTDQALGGLMAGIPIVPEYRRFSFAPGAVADHLTSLAGDFYSPLQTKCTQWLRAGAAASCGTVSEPYAIWSKFPHLRFFAHYQSGLPALEAYMASVASPFQLLLVGDPLANPHGQGVPVPVPLPAKPSLEKPTFREELFKFEASGKFAVALPKNLQSHDEISVTVGWTSKRIFSDQGFTGLVFNYDGPDAFDFFGLHGYRGLWMMGSWRKGAWSIHEVWGEPIFMHEQYTLGLSWEGDIARGSINGRPTCSHSLKRSDSGAIGLLRSGLDEPAFRRSGTLAN